MSSKAVESPANVETVETRPLGLLVCSKTRNYVTEFPYSADAETLGTEFPTPRHAEFSPTGDYFVSVEGTHSPAVIRYAVDATVVATCGGETDEATPLKINFAKFSPRGSYLLTWARPVRDVHVPNLVIYSVPTGDRLAAFHQKTFHLGFWPSIQWSDDEKIAARVVTNTVHIFHGDALDKPPYAKLGIPGVSKCALSRGAAPYTVAAFIPGKNDAPGKIALYSHPDEGGKQLCSRSTYRADMVTFLWNPKGTALLTLLSTNVDATGKSYYGESEVLYMDSKGTMEQRVELPQQGPTYDAAWSPTGNEFIICYGFMPSRTTMFNDKCEPVYDFGTGSRNTISFSPHGRYVALAGFGNLAGAVEFWDKNKTVLVGRADLPCTTLFSWSPCSRYFLSVTTFPRLRVDNGLRVVRFDGKEIHSHSYKDTELYQAVFRPALRGTYADPKFTGDDMIGGAVQAVENVSAKATAEKKGGVYRPPGSRGVASSVVLHRHLEAGKVDKAAFMASVASAGASGGNDSSLPAGKRFVPGMAPDVKHSVPGMPPQELSKAQLARRRKKERERERQAAAGPSSNGTNQANGGGIDDSHGAVGVEDAAASIGTIEAGDKKAKKLRKKLRTIENLKADKMAGKELNQDQLDKIGSAPSVERELLQVEKRIAELGL